MKIARRTGTGIALTAVAALALAGCSGGGAADREGPKTEVSWMAILHSPTPPEPDGPVESALQEHTGIDIDFQWVPDSVREEKLSAALASDRLTDIVTLPRVNDTTIRRALTSGQFWDIEEYLDDFPNLAEIDPQTLEGARIDGYLYGVPIQKPKARYGVLVRQDWLDNLGLELPHTIDELGEVARAFAHDDPDGNGKDDTYGILDRQESFSLGFATIAGYFGAGLAFELDDDDNVISSYDTPALKEAMEWYRDLYDDGAINHEFVTLQKADHMDAYGTGKGGIFIGTLDTGSGFTNLAADIDPGSPMVWSRVNDMTYEDVPRRITSDTNGGLGGWLAISKSSVTNEEDLRIVLGFIDGLMDEEAFSVMTNGVEGTHFQFDDDGVVEILDQKKWTEEVEIFKSSRPSELVTTYLTEDPTVNEANEMIAENADYAVTNVAQSLSSKTFDSRWSQIGQVATDAYNKFMVGEIDIDGYQSAIDEARADGLGQIEQEFTASYREVNQ